MIIFVGGDNDYAIAEHISKLRSQYAKKFADALDEISVDCREDGIAGLEQALLAMPMFFSHRLVLIRNIDGLKDQLDTLEALLLKVPETTVAVFDGRGLDKRIKLYKFLSGTPKAKLYPRLSQPERLKWLVSLARREGAELGTAQAQYLVNRVGEDEWRLAQEVKRLSLTGEKITNEVIDENVAENISDSVFDLISALSKRNAGAAAKVYERVSAAGASDQQLLATLAWHYRVLTLAIERASESELAACGVKPYAAAKAAELTRSMSRDDVAAGYRALLDAEIAIKTGQKQSHQAMQDLVVELSTK